MSGPLKSSILIVDSDARTLLVSQELLDSPDRNIVTAKSGEEVLHCVQSTDFAVVLLDVRMPDMDGFAISQCIRNSERSRHTPIIFLTDAYEDTVSASRSYEAGAVDYLLKPVVPEILRSKISVFIELDRYNAALAREAAERKVIEQNLRSSEERLRAFAAHIQSVREQERTSIAREIHDELGQALTGLRMDLSWLEKKLPRELEEPIKKIKPMLRLIDATIQSVRRIASELRPHVLDDVGLSGTIKWQAREFQMRTGIRCKASLPAEDFVLDQERSTAVFRIFQEVLANVTRHAKATRVDIDLRLDNVNLILKIVDNGRGISAADLRNPKSLGLLGIRERAVRLGGHVEVKGIGGKGTTVAVSIPRSADKP